MTELKVKAYAKLNLTVDILSKRSDGYHDMCMIMQSVTLCDDIEIKIGGEGTGIISTNLTFLPRDSRNIAMAAANAFIERAGVPSVKIDLVLNKSIPVCAGMGGGSADAAAVLNALNIHYGGPLSQESLEELARALGSDVPFCLRGGTALAEGRGEILTPLPPMPDCWILICKPEFSISTPALFKKLDCGKITTRPDTAGALSALEEGNLPKLCRRMFNVFEECVARDRNEIGDIKRRLINGGALGAAMTGTGPAVFGVFDDQELAVKCREELSADYQHLFLVTNRNYV